MTGRLIDLPERGPSRAVLNAGYRRLSHAIFSGDDRLHALIGSDLNDLLGSQFIVWAELAAFDAIATIVRFCARQQMSGVYTEFCIAGMSQ